MSTSNRDGRFEKQNEDCNEGPSAYECMLFEMEFSKSFIFRRNKAGTNIDPFYMMSGIVRPLEDNSDFSGC